MCSIELGKADETASYLAQVQATLAAKPTGPSEAHPVELFTTIKGELLAHQGHYSEALIQYRRVVEIAKFNTWESDALQARLFRDRALAYQALNQRSPAADLLKEAQTRYSFLISNYSPEIVRHILAMGKVYLTWKKPDDVGTLYRNLQGALDYMHYQKHAEYADLLEGLATVAIAQGKTDQAAQYSAHSKQIRKALSASVK